ncbi:MAG: pyruvate:ferredoxin (flavodoxin) oxidoreductase [Candidatus Margulisiibacteriota bacterium]|nr:MAG: pyruvate:ferredoxin (flavodoxin) oxidoreductase [Candidatus Margulisiibacteriota bacterium]HCY35740.1 pyruvate:ferredoxin (flavodoxin) oxidoreductase [Candidatus Margulisiibacteriota bacterium]
MNRKKVSIDGNQAAAYCAYHLNEVITIYPITPSSPMGELADQWSKENVSNIWGTVPHVTEMQSEAGAAGAVHGSLQTGALTTTFTASQGLLLMLPNMYKIAGELNSTVFHVTARTIATHALSIFCDHSDVMAARSTGFALLASNSVQEAMDFALIAQAATLESRIPFLHFFDGFRTSHEISKIEELTVTDLRAMIDETLVRQHRERALSPDHPFIRGTSQNPDVFFQARETANPYYAACPSIVQKIMDKFAGIAGRQYSLFQYTGAPDADRIIVLIGSGAQTVQETVEHLNRHGEKVGVLKVRLYRPFSLEHFIAAIPKTVTNITVLDRTKEPGSQGEPLYLDVVAAINEAHDKGISHFSQPPRITGGRYGLSSKEFYPPMVKAIFDNMDKNINHFTVGIKDDVTYNSLDYDESFSIEPEDRTRAIFYGLGADGTVSANKNSIKIIGEGTDNYAQGYFVYDSHKAGSLTISHLRFGPAPIDAPYLITQANFVACHQFEFVERLDILKVAQHNAPFLLNSPYPEEQVWDHLPRTAQEHIINKNLRFFVIDAYKIARDIGLDVRINTIMQTCFFALSKVIPIENAISTIKHSIEKSYGKHGDVIVKMNFQAVDEALNNLHEVKVPGKATSSFDFRPVVPDNAPEFVQIVTAKLLTYEGDDLPVSAFAPDGTFPSGTTKYEKRNIAKEIPAWDTNTCIQCGKCSLVCPHAVIRAKVYDPAILEHAPDTFKSTPARMRPFQDKLFTLQVSPEDCTGCTLCVVVCPAKNQQEPRLKAINMVPQAPIREQEVKNWEFFSQIPEIDRSKLNLSLARDIQFLQPLFEFSAACAGCGETPYLKLLSQLFGERIYIANATGCSSIYGGNLPTTPWTTNREGKGPAWSNSLFEDNAEFGFGMKQGLNKQIEYAKELLQGMSEAIGNDLVEALLNAEQNSESDIDQQRERIKTLKEKLAMLDDDNAKMLLSIADLLARKNVWIVGGDGWAYDIGYGGLDHVLALGANINILVLDTEIYSNTGGQMSKATPRGAVAKFAAAGKKTAKKDLAMLAMVYGNVYVARIAMGADDAQSIKAFREAQAYDGPSIIVAYSHCIGQGYNLAYGMQQQKAAVLSGYWPLIRYNPALVKEGKSPLQLDSKPASIPLEDYIYNETRYSILVHSNPEEAKLLLARAKEDVAKRWKLYEHWAKLPV